MSLHWSDEDDRDVEQWHAESVEKAGGELFHYAAWREVMADWDRRWAAGKLPKQPKGTR